MKILKLVAASVAAILLVCVGTLFAMSRRADAGREHAVIEINRPPEHVFRYLSEPEKVKAWVSWLVEIRSTGQGLGARDTWIMEDANNNNERMEINAVVVEWDPPRTVALDISSPLGFTGQQKYTVTPTATGSRLEVTGAYTYQRWYWQLLEPLVTPQAQKKLDGDLAKMKELAEKQ